MSNYRKTMGQAMQEMYEAKMSSSQIARLKKAYEPMRNKKISVDNANKLSAMMDKVGKDKEALIQLFKADIPFVSQSAVTQLISKHGMKGAEINKLREEFNVESVDLDEGKVTKKERDRLEDQNEHGLLALKLTQAYGTPEEVKKIKEINKRHEKRGSISREDQQARQAISGKYYRKAEEVDLDEASPNKQKSDVIVMKKDNVEKSVVGASGVKKAEKDGYKIQYALLAPSGKKVTDPKGIMKAIKSADKLGIGEEVDLDEANFEIKNGKIHISKADYAKKPKEYKGKRGGKPTLMALDPKTGSTTSFEVVLEEADLDEGKMSQLHQYIKDKKSAEEIAKLMKLDVKTIKALMSSHHPEDIEEGAAADARRAMKKDKDFSRKDSADDDDSATDDDIKGASKNIIMQMRKAVSMRGNFPVEFLDKKKVKIPAKIAQAVQRKYDSMKKPADKEKFQAQIAKSHKDMLQSLKAGYGEQKESILDRIGRKLKENKNG